MDPLDPQLLETVKADLMQLDGVEAVGESMAEGQPCVKVYFSNEDALHRANIARCNGIPILLIVSGEIRKQV